MADPVSPTTPLMDANTLFNLLTERAKQCPAGPGRQLWEDAARFVATHAFRAADVLALLDTALLDTPPTPEQMIRSLHAWIATYHDGTEGIIAHGLPGLGMTPLVTSRHHVAVRMQPIARHAMALSQAGEHRVAGVRLVSFEVVDKPV